MKKLIKKLLSFMLHEECHSLSMLRDKLNNIRVPVIYRPAVLWLEHIVFNPFFRHCGIQTHSCKMNVLTHVEGVVSAIAANPDRHTITKYMKHLSMILNELAKMDAWARLHGKDCRPPINLHTLEKLTKDHQQEDADCRCWELVATETRTHH